MTSDSAPAGIPDLFDLSGKTAIVTGGTQGVGLMLARGLVQAGARVWVCSRKAEACVKAESELRRLGDAVAVRADLSDEDGCASFADQFCSSETELQILVNNAGATWGASLAEFPVSGWTRVLSLNLVSPFLLVQALLPALERGARDHDPSRVINIGSIHGLHVSPLPNYSYGASKAGVHHLTRVLAKDLGPKNITVNAIAPGPFRSRMMEATLATHGDAFAAESPLGRLGREEDVVGAAVYLSSRASSWVTGVVLPVDGGISTTR